MCTASVIKTALKLQGRCPSWGRDCRCLPICATSLHARSDKNLAKKTHPPHLHVLNRGKSTEGPKTDKSKQIHFLGPLQLRPRRKAARLSFPLSVDLRGPILHTFVYYLLYYRLPTLSNHHPPTVHLPLLRPLAALSAGARPSIRNHGLALDNSTISQTPLLGV